MDRRAARVARPRRGVDRDCRSRGAVIRRAAAAYRAFSIASGSSRAISVRYGLPRGPVLALASDGRIVRGTIDCLVRETDGDIAGPGVQDRPTPPRTRGAGRAVSAGRGVALSGKPCRYTTSLRRGRGRLLNTRSRVFRPNTARKLQPRGGVSVTNRPSCTSRHHFLHCACRIQPIESSFGRDD